MRGIPVITASASVELVFLPLTIWSKKILCIETNLLFINLVSLSPKMPTQ